MAQSSTLCQQLIIMGYSGSIALEAAKRCSSMNEAVKWIKHNNYDTTQNDIYQSYHSIHCDGNKIKTCIPLKRIISMLSFYHNNHNDYSEISKYLEKYKAYLINDYHHILEQHLNEDKMSKLESNKQFELIYKQIIKENKLYCDVKNCQIYSRNNRQRETTHIECKDKTLCLMIDFMDTIHCYFIHSVDIGYRFIHSFDASENKDNDDNYSNAFDPEIKQLKEQLLKTREVIETIRGQNRLKHSKFMTNANDKKYTEKDDEKHHDDYKDDDNAEALSDELIQMNVEKDEEFIVEDVIEGYLERQSLYLKQFKKRFVILKDNHLYCYKSEQKAKLIEAIDLSQYSWVSMFDGAVGQFELTPRYNSKASKQIFKAKSIDQCTEWVSNIKQVIYLMRTFKLMEDAETSKTFEELLDDFIVDEQESDNDGEAVFCFGEGRDYWSKKMGIFSPKGRYKSIKEEVTSNKIYAIEMDELTNAYNKAQHLMDHSSKVKSLSADSYPEYGIKRYTAASVANILSLVLYTDYDTLCFKFSSTWREMHSDEPYGYHEKRNDEFWNWSKTLIETVNAFGTTLKHSKIYGFYHGLSFMYFKSFMTSINSPTSTTTKLQIAHQFASYDGIIVELGKIKSDWRSENAKYFNCSFLSAFSNEDERLFIQPLDKNIHLHLLSIRNVSTNENYEKYISAINVLQRLTEINTDTMLTELESINNATTNITEECMECVNDLISVFTDHETNHEKFPDYITQLIHVWTSDITGIRISVQALKNLAPNVALYDSDKQDIVRIDKLNMIFKNIRLMFVDHIVCNTISYWTEIALMLRRINNLTFSELHEIKLEMDDINELVEFDKYQLLCSDQNWILSQETSSQLLLARQGFSNDLFQQTADIIHELQYVAFKNGEK